MCHTFILMCVVCTFLAIQTVGEYFDTVNADYITEPPKPPLNLTVYDDLAPVCFDAMWTLALALNSTIQGIHNVVYE